MVRDAIAPMAPGTLPSPKMAMTGMPDGVLSPGSFAAAKMRYSGVKVDPNALPANAAAVPVVELANSAAIASREPSLSKSPRAAAEVREEVLMAAEAKLLASFVPVMMLHAISTDSSELRIQPPSSSEHHGAALFADISGFSGLNDYFGLEGGAGLAKMMGLVNMYFQQMIKITSACGGDVIKFAGDAVLSIWSSNTSGEGLETLTHRAIACALEQIVTFSESAPC